MTETFYPEIKYSPVIYPIEKYQQIVLLSHYFEEFTLEEFEKIEKLYPDLEETVYYKLLSQETNLDTKSYRKLVKDEYNKHPDNLLLKLEFAFQEISAKNTEVVKDLFKNEIQIIYGKETYPELISDVTYFSLLEMLAQLAFASKDQELSQQLYLIANGLQQGIKLDIYYHLAGIKRDYSLDLQNEEASQYLLSKGVDKQLMQRLAKVDFEENVETYDEEADDSVFEISTESYDEGFCAFLREAVKMPEEHKAPHYDFSFKILNRDLDAFDTALVAKLDAADKDKLESDLRWIMFQSTVRMEDTTNDGEFILLVFYLAAYYEMTELANDLLYFISCHNEADTYKLLGDFVTESILFPIYHLGKRDISVIRNVLRRRGLDVHIRCALAEALGHLSHTATDNSIKEILDELPDLFYQRDPDMIPWFGLAMAASRVTDYNKWIEQMYKEDLIPEQIYGPYEEMISPYSHPELTSETLLEYIDYLKRLFRPSIETPDFQKTITDYIESHQKALYKKHQFYTKIKKLVSKKHQAEKQMTVVRNSKKISRNDPCPCGSGTKYKKCCWGKSS